MMEELLEDETTITEISIEPDGRVYVFGTSRQVLQLLQNLDPGDQKLARLLSHVRAVEASRVEQTVVDVRRA